ncbi:MAG: hypothetical protein HC854_02725 [Flavobacterium sp.]|nr:hypothetical protein [Flavobacterium sp.]
MKKVLFTIIAIYSFSIANAQEEEVTVSPILSKKGENYLPQIDDWAISFNADGVFEYIGNAFNGNTGNRAPGLDNARSNSFVGKKFISDKKAHRVVVNLGYNNNKETSIVDLNPIDPLNPILKNKEEKISDFDIALGLGKEWRKGNTRLQGFYGADVLLTANSNNNKVTITEINDGSFFQSTEVKSGLGIGFGIQGFLGAEYFIFPKFALGAQYTYRVGVDVGGKRKETRVDAANNSNTSDLGGTTAFGLGNVGVASINLSLYF